MHTLAPVARALYAPAPHAVHARDDAAAATLPYLPTAHAVHALAPVARALYVPAAHDVHTGPAVEIVPPVLYVPIRQAAHPPEPDCLPYPGAQLRAAITTSSTVSTRDVVAKDE